MCVVLVYFLTLRMSIFEEKNVGRYVVDFVNKTSRDLGGGAQTKSGHGAIGYRRKLPSVEINIPRDITFIIKQFW